MLSSKDNFRYRYRFNDISAFIEDSTTNQNLRTAGQWDFYNWMDPTALDRMHTVDCQYNPRTFDEKHWLGELNVKVPLRITENINIDFKAGGKYKRIDRNYDEVGLQYYQDVFSQVNRSISDWLTNTIHHEPIEGLLYFDEMQDIN